MSAIRMIFRAIGGLYLFAVLVIGIGGTWLQYRISDIDEAVADKPSSRSAKAARARAWEPGRSSRSYAREEEYEVRQAERESMGCDPSYGDC